MLAAPATAEAVSLFQAGAVLLGIGLGVALVLLFDALARRRRLRRRLAARPGFVTPPIGQRRIDDPRA